VITFAIGARYHPLRTATIEAGQGSIADHNGGYLRLSALRLGDAR